MKFSVLVVVGFILCVVLGFMVLLFLIDLMVDEWPADNDTIALQVYINVCNNFIECALGLLRRE